MLYMEAEEACRKAQGILLQLRSKYDSEEGKQRTWTIIRREFAQWIEAYEKEEYGEAIQLKEKLFSLKRTNESLEKRVSFLEGRIKSRERDTEQQRLAYMREIIGLKEAIYSNPNDVFADGNHQDNDGSITFVDNDTERDEGSVIRRDEGLGEKRGDEQNEEEEEVVVEEEEEECKGTEDSKTTAADTENIIERFRFRKPGLGSFASGLDELEERTSIDEKQQRISTSATAQQKIKILTTRLHSAQERIKQIFDDLTTSQQVRMEQEKELLELERKLEALEKFDVKSMKAQIARLTQELEMEQSAHQRTRESSVVERGHVQEQLEELQKEKVSQLPMMQRCLEVFESQLSTSMHKFSETVNRALQENENRLRTMEENVRDVVLSLRYSPEAASLQRKLVHLENVNEKLVAELHELKSKLGSSEDGKQKRNKPIGSFRSKSYRFRQTRSHRLQSESLSSMDTYASSVRTLQTNLSFAKRPTRSNDELIDDNPSQVNEEQVGKCQSNEMEQRPDSFLAGENCDLAELCRRKRVMYSLNSRIDKIKALQDALASNSQDIPLTYLPSLRLAMGEGMLKDAIVNNFKQENGEPALTQEELLRAAAQELEEATEKSKQFGRKVNSARNNFRYRREKKQIRRPKTARTHREQFHFRDFLYHVHKPSQPHTLDSVVIEHQ